jgi:hypothetical protein
VPSSRPNEPRCRATGAGGKTHLNRVTRTVDRLTQEKGKEQKSVAQQNGSQATSRRIVKQQTSRLDQQPPVSQCGDGKRGAEPNPSGHTTACFPSCH